MSFIEDYIDTGLLQEPKRYCKNSERIEDCSKCNNKGCENYDTNRI